MRPMFRLPAALLAAALLVRPAAGQSLREVAPEAAGLSRAGLDRVDAAMQAYIDEQKLPGIVIAIAHDGKLAHWRAFGVRSVEANDPMRPDDLFRIMSMTKPITSAAAMILVDEGKLGLDDPLSKYLPAFGQVKVWTPAGLQAPRRPITIRDLLRHTSGLTYGFFGSTHVDSLYRRAGLQRAKTLSELVGMLAQLPLLGQPGEVWNYSYSTDVLGRVIEVASGQPLDHFLGERIFKPLGMHNTFFQVPPSRRGRFTGYYSLPAPGRWTLSDSPDTGSYAQPVTLLSGGGGLVSSASDYLRFAQMILDGGELDGVRILRKESAAQMLRNQLPDKLIPVAVAGNRLEGTGFGLGFSVRVKPGAPEDGPVGLAGWGGYANTFFWIDPENHLIGLIMTQFYPFQAYPIEAEFRHLVYGALK